VGGIKVVTVLKGINFLFAGKENNETKVAEDYCWAITQAADQVPV
jgi:hypothetical protein